MKKVLLIIFFIGLAGELIWGVNYILKSKVKNTVLETQSKIPCFDLLPREKNFKVGEESQIQIVLDSAGKSLSGADAVLLYDPKMVEVLEIIPGKIFPSYPLFNINKNKSKITIIGTVVSPSQKPFTGHENYAIIKLKFLQAGETKLKFDFYPGSTTDSNLTQKDTGKDILDTVYNGSYTIIE